MGARDQLEGIKRMTRNRRNAGAWRIYWLAIIAFFWLIATTPWAKAQDFVRLGDAESGALLLKTNEAGQYLEAPQVAADVAIEVTGPIIRTRITQRFDNPSDQWVEGVYVFPLPEDSGVDRLKMRIGERFIEGEIKESPARGQATEMHASTVHVFGGADADYLPHPWFWSDQYDVKLQIAGLNTGYEDVVVRDAGAARSHWYYDGERLLSVDAMNDPRAYMVGKRLIEAGRSPPRDAVADAEADLKAFLRG